MRDHGKHAMWGDVWPRRPGTGSASRLQLHAQAREQDLPAIALQALYHHAAIAVQVDAQGAAVAGVVVQVTDRKSTRLNSSHSQISYAVFCLKKKKKKQKKILNGLR